MTPQERLDKTEEVLHVVLEQIKEAEPGSKEQLTSAQVYDTLNKQLIDEQKLAFAADDQEYKKNVDDQEYSDNFKDKKWKRKMEVAGLVTSVAVPVISLATVLVAETTNVFTRLASKSIVSKVLNFKK